MALQVNSKGYAAKNSGPLITSDITVGGKSQLCVVEGLVNFATSNLATGGKLQFKLTPFTASGTNYLTLPAGARIVDMDVVVHTATTTDTTTTLGLSYSPDGTTMTSIYAPALLNATAWQTPGFYKASTMFTSAGSSTDAIVQSKQNLSAATSFYAVAAAGTATISTGIVYLKIKALIP